MKKYSQYLIGGLCVLSIAFSAGSFMKVNAAAASPAMPAQPVDLTFAAEKALPAVVHIRYVQNSKVQTVEVQSDPFSDFFDDFFGKSRKRQWRNTKATSANPEARSYWFGCYHIGRRLYRN